MKQAVAIGVVGILVAGAGVGRAQGPSTSTYSFGPHTFSVALPAGFSLVNSDGDARYKIFRFSSPHDDGTRAVIQFVLMDMLSMNEMVPLDEFSAGQIKTLQDAMPDLKQAARSIELGGVAVRRVDWTGTTISGNVRLASAGILLLGVKGRLAFRIDLRDGQSFAARNLPMYEEAVMKSFALRVATVPGDVAPAPAPPAPARPPVPASQAPLAFTKPASATSEIPLLDDRVVVSFDPSVWRELPDNRPGAPRSLQHVRGDVSVTIVSERRQIPMESWPSIVRGNGEKAATDARIAEQEHRRVNGLDVMMIRMEATISGTPYTFFGYYYSSDAGSIQLVTYTRQSAFAEHRSEVEQLLNGLHLKGAVLSDAAAAVQPSVVTPNRTPPSPPAPSAPASSGTASVLAGTVRLRGAPPPPIELRMAADPACVAAVGPSVNLQRVLVDASGGLQNVFVYVRDGLNPSAVFPQTTTSARLDQKGCQYVPRVLGVRVGQPLQIVNSDPTFANPHALPKVNAEFNIGQPIQGMTTAHTFTKPEVMVPVKDDIHGWKNAFIGVVAHPFFAVTGPDGSFRIDGLPPGTYVVAAWHEVYGTATQRVTVGGGQTGNLSFEFSPASGGGR